MTDSGKISKTDFQPAIPEQDLSNDSYLSNAIRDERGRPTIGGNPVIALLGHGGMGAVYYGYNPRLHSPIAIKVLPFNLARKNETIIKRFFTEAQLAARVRSPNVVNVYDVNEENGIHYIAMEFIDGMSAGSLVKNWRKGDTIPPLPPYSQSFIGLPVLSALNICLGATRGLASAHDLEIIHRDVKPDNILIPFSKRKGRLSQLDLASSKIADLGLAKPEESDSLGTVSQIAMGTPGYMAPEQAEDAKRADKRSDVFAMGATLYALLSARPPFQASGVGALLLKTITQPHPPLSEISPETPDYVCALVDRCLSKMPDERPQDANDLFDELDAVAQRFNGGPLITQSSSQSRIIAKPETETSPTLMIGDANNMQTGNSPSSESLSRSENPTINIEKTATPFNPTTNLPTQTDVTSTVAQSNSKTLVYVISAGILILFSFLFFYFRSSSSEKNNSGETVMVAQPLPIPPLPENTTNSNKPSDAELKKILEEEQKRKDSDEAARRLAEEEQKRKEAELEAQRLADEDQKRKEAELAAQRLADEEQKRQAAELAAQRLADEEQKRQAAELAAQRLADAEQKRKEAELAAQRLADEEQKRQAAELEAKMLAEEDQRQLDAAYNALIQSGDASEKGAIDNPDIDFKEIAYLEAQRLYLEAKSLKDTTDVNQRIERCRLGLSNIERSRARDQEFIALMKSANSAQDAARAVGNDNDALRQWRMAAEDYRRAMNIRPDDTQAPVSLTRCEKAIKTIEDRLDKASAMERYNSHISRANRLEAMINDSETLYDLSGRYISIRDAYSNALNEWPSSTVAQTAFANTMKALDEVNSKIDRYEAANSAGKDLINAAKLTEDDDTARRQILDAKNEYLTVLTLAPYDDAARGTLDWINAVLDGNLPLTGERTLLSKWSFGFTFGYFLPLTDWGKTSGGPLFIADIERRINAQWQASAGLSYLMTTIENESSIEESSYVIGLRTDAKYCYRNYYASVGVEFFYEIVVNDGSIDSTPNQNATLGIPIGLGVRLRRRWDIRGEYILVPSSGNASGLALLRLGAYF